jgi:hypothetical protein
MRAWEAMVAARNADSSDHEIAALTKQQRNGSVKQSDFVDEWNGSNNPDSSLNATLTERHNSYGKFEDNARTAQAIKWEMRMCPKWDDLAADQKEALHQIASKISRLLSGDVDHLDSWRDIAGYATLVAERLQGNAR